jgi:glycosyltransferase involved in cell wall biosynthesis
MKVLVIAEGYPSQDNLYNLAYIHSRLLHYVKNGIAVKVLSFQANKEYEFEGIVVTNLETFNKTDSLKDYDLLISHAPNLRNHVIFILSRIRSVNNLLFFIHGHEVLIKKNYYPSPYGFDRGSIVKGWINLIYDLIKVKLLKLFFNYVLLKKTTHIVFVSEWMKEETLKNVFFNKKFIKRNTSVINNNINPIFFDDHYNPSQEKWGDFITIRPLDNSKYALDVVCEVAKMNPSYSFHVYGKGKFFSYNEMPNNLVWHNRYLKQNEMPEVLNHYSCGLMPTRLDSQGVSVCEFASFGIPLYTSDLNVCREMLGEFENVKFFSINLKEGFKSLRPFDAKVSNQNKRKFSFEETVYREIELIKEFFKKD